MYAEFCAHSNRQRRSDSNTVLMLRGFNSVKYNHLNCRTSWTTVHVNQPTPVSTDKFIKISINIRYLSVAIYYFHIPSSASSIRIIELFRVLYSTEQAVLENVLLFNLSIYLTNEMWHTVYLYQLSRNLFLEGYSYLGYTPEPLSLDLKPFLQPATASTSVQLQQPFSCGHMTVTWYLDYKIEY